MASSSSCGPDELDRQASAWRWPTPDITGGLVHEDKDNDFVDKEPREVRAWGFPHQIDEAVVHTDVKHGAKLPMESQRTSRLHRLVAGSFSNTASVEAEGGRGNAICSPAAEPGTANGGVTEGSWRRPARFMVEEEGLVKLVVEYLNSLAISSLPHGCNLRFTLKA